jgi:hypothetical protein
MRAKKPNREEIQSPIQQTQRLNSTSTTEKKKVEKKASSDKKTDRFHLPVPDWFVKKIVDSQGNQKTR